MASPIIPKSKIRQIDNISVGYGEVPAVTKGGLTGWGLPGRGVTFCAEEAYKFAAMLDRTIRANLSHPSRSKLI